MDFKGQLHCERTFQILVVLFGIIGFIAGYIQQEFRITFLFLSTGGGISAVICLPDWPWWNRHPLDWVPAPEEEEVEVKKKKKKKDEWQMEYFILLQTKHIVHFQPNTGFVDPFKKTISGKSIDLMSAEVGMPEDPSAVSKIPPDLAPGVDTSEDNIFEIRTARQVIQLCPKETTAEAWLEKITEVMLALDEGEEDVMDAAESRDYGAAMAGYYDVKPDEAPGGDDAVTA
uniref:Signal peptidase complex subunit 1 n=1 Tax=Haptolina ericina TaxID=156174 RepID=A0A7S3BMF8_9EUKA|mmetsp:Transcript_6369/g.14152  ORF Transcript_6369/g.14152 Transcript_6369/m.14152 type:complete len:230 (+) Transcript_6369:3-692(+)